MYQKTVAALFILLSQCLIYCGSKEEDKKTSTDTKYTFATNIAPIVLKSCAGAATCHGTGESGGNNGTIFQDNMATFIASAADIKELIQLPSTDASVMPKSGYGITLSSTDKQILLDYLNQSTKN